MNPLILSLIASVLQKVIPDPTAAAAAQFEAAKLAQSGELAQMDAAKALALAQIDVNKADAQGQSPMQRNARPFILWTCGAALAWDSIVRPAVILGAAVAGHPLPALPTLSSDQLMGLLSGILGLGGFRTIEKVKGMA